LRHRQYDTHQIAEQLSSARCRSKQLKKHNWSGEKTL
jgi:hypothetical protein